MIPGGWSYTTAVATLTASILPGTRSRPSAFFFWNMPKDRYRVLFVATHPVQYQSPIFRRMAEHPRLHIQVAYCSLQGAEARIDPEFGVEVKWDVPLLE